ncbi:MAG TPA: 3'-5' exonuclease, partial [Longimicrobiales bacterium]
TVLKVAELAQAQRIGFVDALLAAGPDVIGAAAHRAVAEFLALLEDERQKLRAAEAAAAAGPPGPGLPPIARWAEAFLRRTGIEEAIRSDPRNERSAAARIDNIRDVVGSIARFERRVWGQLGGVEGAGGGGHDAAATQRDRSGDAATTISSLGEAQMMPAEHGAAPSARSPLDEAWTPPCLADALARIALTDLEDRADDDREDDASIALMTLHSAKGLEFPDVFIVGLEEEILPHARSIEAASDPEIPGHGDPLAEERRLLYVGITRARNRLTLSYCRARRRNGELVPRLPSRYLEDIPADLLEVKSAKARLTPEESAELRRNFFAQMKAMLADDAPDADARARRA